VQFTNQSINANSYFWDFHNIGHSVDENPSFNFPETNKYLVTLVASDGICSDTAFQIIECLPGFTFYAPNIFTPNNDQLNERFLPIGEGWNLETYNLIVFDRWGSQIFASKKWNEGWNGTYKGEIVKDEVYVWKVTLKDLFGKPHEYLGHVAVVK
jgi:gliding motility-associated-like protein